MARYTSATAYNAGLRARFAKIPRSMQLGHQKALNETISKKADRLLSGTMSKRELRKRRPYSRRHPDYSVHRLPIHAHTKRLKNSKRMIPTRDGFRLSFTAPYSKYVLRPGGTGRMRARGFWTELKKDYPRVHTRMVKTLQMAHAA